jgi:hypothetical protein
MVDAPTRPFDWRWFFVGVRVMLVLVIMNRIIG